MEVDKLLPDIADSFLITAARGTVDALVRQAEQQQSLGWGFEGDLEKLHANLMAIRDLLRDAKDRRFEQIKEWLKDLRPVISGAEKVLDELGYEAVRRKMEVGNLTRNKVRNFFSLSNPLAFRLKLVLKVKHINSLIARIREQANNIQSDNLYDIIPRKTFIYNSVIVGRESDVSMVIRMLLDPDTESKVEHGVPVIAVVGIPGVGKTTLAQIVYNHEAVVKNFGDNKMWISLSHDFKVGRLLGEMVVQSLPRVTHDPQDIQEIETKLQRSLNGKRYLVVFDNLVDINGDEWEHVMNALLRIGGSEGSRIIVTTSCVEVSLTPHISPYLFYQLSPLNDEYSWTMFRRIAFGDGGPRETQSLVQIGLSILQKCKGVPFKIKSFASLCHLTHDESAWMSIYNDDEQQSSVPNKAQVQEQFRLNFDELPLPSLKQCFAYCAVYPKGYHMKKEELIYLWTNLGYLHPPLDLHQPLESNLEMEDIGNYYCKVLMDQSLLQQVEMDEYKNVTSYKIPDHIHDLAVHLYEGYRLTLEPSGRKYHTVADHLSLDFCEEKGIDIPKGNAEMLTALFPQIGVDVNRTLAFGLFGDDVEKLPNSLCKFVRLRYLDLSETSIRKLPKFITKLYNLQTLKLPRDLIELPKQFHKLVSLRHLCMPDSLRKRNLMPMKIGKLTCLQTLPFFVVGKGIGHSIKELGSLSKLSGRLHVYGLQHVKNKEEAEKANISVKSGIQELGFHWDCKAKVEGDTNTSNQEDVLEGLRPHSNIQGFILENFGGRSFPLWMMSIDSQFLQNLVKIELRDCSLCEHVPSLGHLPFLEIIEIVKLGNLKCIGPEFCGSNGGGAPGAVAFPALRKLTLYGMPMLAEWSLPAVPSIAVLFPQLRELYISDCPKLIDIPSRLLSIQELTISSVNRSDAESGKNCHRCLTICSTTWDSENVENLLEKVSESLRNLTIRGLNELYDLPNKLWNLESLEKLAIIECSNLTFDMKEVQGFKGLTSLQQLSIKRCRNLIQLPPGLVQQTLVTVEIDNCQGLRTIEFGSLKSLKNLMIKGCPELERWWGDRLSNTSGFQTSEIVALSEELEDFPRPSINAAVSAGNANVDVDIQQSHRYVQPQPDASTSALIAATAELQTLEIGAFSKENFPWPSNVDVDIQQSQRYVQPQPDVSTIAPIAAKQPSLSFMYLKTLHLWGWQKLACLPEGLQHLTTLTELSIHSFPSLEALPDWLANLASLQSLELHSCKNLAILPKERLFNLRQLTIANCPVLGKRCGKRTGAEWAKIAHIPFVKFSFSAEEP